MYNSRQFKYVLQWRIRKQAMLSNMKKVGRRSDGGHNGYHIYLKATSRYKFQSLWNSSKITLEDIDDEVVMKINTFKDMYSRKSSPPLTLYPAVLHHRKNMKRFFTFFVHYHMQAIQLSSPPPPTSSQLLHPSRLTAPPFLSSQKLPTSSTPTCSGCSTPQSTSSLLNFTPDKIDEDIDTPYPC